MMMTVLVADAAIARIFSAENRHASLTEVKQIKNPSGRKREQELTSDLPGRILSSGGGSHSYQAADTHKHHDTEKFAAQIISILRELYELRSLGDLVVIASPDFLGELRKSMPAVLRKQIILEKSKDLTGTETQEIQAHLRGYFQRAFMH